MATVRKTERADMRKRYPVFIEVGFLLALGLLIFAFKVDMQASSDFVVPETEQEVIVLDEIKPTKQIEQPPPPPKPPVPVEVPDDEILEDEALDLDASLDIDEPIADTPPPPPAPVEEEEAEEEEPEIFVIVEDMPELIGGLASIQSKIKYPEIAKKAGVEGRVIVQFVIDREGNVTDPQVVRGIGGGCDEEAVRAVLQAKFKPGKQRGKPVPVRMSLPVTFKLK